MRRLVTNALLVASVPIGVGVGLWTALLSVAVGRGTYICSSSFLCHAAVGTPFERWQSALLGAGTTVAVILIALAASPFGSARTAKSAASAMLGAATGVVTGFWTASMTYSCPAFCLYALPRFAVWQSCLVGGAAAVIVLLVAGMRDRELVRGIVQRIRYVSRYLFEDLNHPQVDTLDQDVVAGIHK